MFDEWGFSTFDLSSRQHRRLRIRGFSSRNQWRQAYGDSSALLRDLDAAREPGSDSGASVRGRLRNIVVLHGFDSPFRSGAYTHIGHLVGGCPPAGEQLGPYSTLLQGSGVVDVDTVRQIELDLPRTFCDQRDFAAANGQRSVPMDGSRSSLMEAALGADVADSVQQVGHGTIQDALRRLLRAFCAGHPDIGYLQSMNFVGAFCLLVHGAHQDRCTTPASPADANAAPADKGARGGATAAAASCCSREGSLDGAADADGSAEEVVAAGEGSVGSASPPPPGGEVCDQPNAAAAIARLAAAEAAAYFTFELLCARVLRGYYTHGMELLRTDGDVFRALLATHMPAVATHAEAVGGIDIASLFLPRWLLCVFLNCFPADIVARVWDVMLLETLLEGPSAACRVLLQTGLAVVRMCEGELLAATGFADLAEVLKLLHLRVSDAAELMLLGSTVCSLDADAADADAAAAESATEVGGQARTAVGAGGATGGAVCAEAPIAAPDATPTGLLMHRLRLAHGAADYRAYLQRTCFEAAAAPPAAAAETVAVPEVSSADGSPVRAADLSCGAASKPALPIAEDGAPPCTAPRSDAAGEAAGVAAAPPAAQPMPTGIEREPSSCCSAAVVAEPACVNPLSPGAAPLHRSILRMRKRLSVEFGSSCPLAQQQALPASPASVAERGHGTPQAAARLPPPSIAALQQAASHGQTAGSPQHQLWNPAPLGSACAAPGTPSAVPSGASASGATFVTPPAGHAGAAAGWAAGSGGRLGGSRASHVRSATGPLRLRSGAPRSAAGPAASASAAPTATVRTPPVDIDACVDRLFSPLPLSPATRQRAGSVAALLSQAGCSEAASPATRSGQVFFPSPPVRMSARTGQLQCALASPLAGGGADGAASTLLMGGFSACGSLPDPAVVGLLAAMNAHVVFPSGRHPVARNTPSASETAAGTVTDTPPRLADCSVENTPTRKQLPATARLAERYTIAAAASTTGACGSPSTPLLEGAVGIYAGKLPAPSPSSGLRKALSPLRGQVASPAAAAAGRAAAGSPRKPPPSQQPHSPSLRSPLRKAAVPSALTIKGASDRLNGAVAGDCALALSLADLCDSENGSMHCAAAAMSMVGAASPLRASGGKLAPRQKIAPPHTAPALSVDVAAMGALLNSTTAVCAASARKKRADRQRLAGVQNAGAGAAGSSTPAAADRRASARAPATPVGAGGAGGGDKAALRSSGSWGLSSFASFLSAPERSSARVGGSTAAGGATARQSRSSALSGVGGSGRSGPLAPSLPTPLPHGETRRAPAYETQFAEYDEDAEDLPLPLPLPLHVLAPAALPAGVASGERAVALQASKAAQVQAHAAPVRASARASTHATAAPSDLVTPLGGAVAVTGAPSAASALLASADGETDHPLAHHWHHSTGGDGGASYSHACGDHADVVTDDMDNDGGSSVWDTEGTGSLFSLSGLGLWRTVSASSMTSASTGTGYDAGPVAPPHTLDRSASGARRSIASLPVPQPACATRSVGPSGATGAGLPRAGTASGPGANTVPLAAAAGGPGGALAGSAAPPPLKPAGAPPPAPASAARAAAQAAGLSRPMSLQLSLFSPRQHGPARQPLLAAGGHSAARLLAVPHEAPPAARGMVAHGQAAFAVTHARHCR
jgi:hypothetical protein